MMNPIAMLTQMLMNGGNPTQVLQGFISQNPQTAPAMQMIQGKSPEQLRQTFYNLCQARGLDPSQVASQAGITLPSN